MIHESLPTKIWRVISPVLVHIVVYALTLFAASLILSNSTADPVSYNDAMNANAALFTSIAGIVTIVILFILYRKDNAYDTRFVLKKPKYIFFIIVLAVALVHGLSLFISLFESSDMVESYQQVENALFSSSPLVVIIRTVIIAPICEELIFRILMFRRLKEYTSFWLGALVSSAVFGIYHLNLAQGIFAFFLGLALCLVYDRTKDITVPIIMHACGNLFQVILTYTGIDYSPAIYYPVMIVCLLVAIAICFFVIRPLRSDSGM